jgi:hypothetical protein
MDENNVPTLTAQYFARGDRSHHLNHTAIPPRTWKLANRQRGSTPTYLRLHNLSHINRQQRSVHSLSLSCRRLSCHRSAVITIKSFAFIIKNSHDKQNDSPTSTSTSSSERQESA